MTENIDAVSEDKQQVVLAQPGARIKAALLDYVLLTTIMVMAILRLDVELDFIAKFCLSMMIEAYFIVFWVKFGATPGMRIMRIRISPVEGRFGYPSAIIRRIGMSVSSLCLMIGHLWMIWDKNRQTWQDKMARTLVVEEGGN